MMTEEKIEEQAEEYFKNECPHSYADDREELGEDVTEAFQAGAKWGMKEICQKILEDAYDYSYPIHDPITDEDGPLSVELSDLKEIIKKLGVEL